ncbi:hypothetical protein UlMin_026262 [Ulmus minor]
MGVAVASAPTVQIVESYWTKTMELKWVRPRKPKHNDKSFSISQPVSPPPLPLYISTKRSHLNLDHLRQLYGNCKLSGHLHRKNADAVEAVDVDKLRLAISHSSLVVSVFCKPRDVVAAASDSAIELKDLIERVVSPVSPLNGELVGFGRAVSDLGLTASIYDVMVVPSLRGMGIGKMIVQRIIRMLISREIYDISILCSQNQRAFFEACGFGNDVLGSTTMMYTRTVPEGNMIDKPVGPKLLS